MREHIEMLIEAWTARREAARPVRLPRRGPRAARATYVRPRRHLFRLAH